MSRPQAQPLLCVQKCVRAASCAKANRRSGLVGGLWPCPFHVSLHVTGGRRGRDRGQGPVGVLLAVTREVAMQTQGSLQAQLCALWLPWPQSVLVTFPGL